MRRIEAGVDEAHGDRAKTFSRDPGGDLLQCRLAERPKLLTLRADPPADDEAVLTRDKRRQEDHGAPERMKVGTPM